MKKDEGQIAKGKKLFKKAKMKGSTLRKTK